MDAKAEIERLRREIEEHNERYHVNDTPVISDFEYDALTRRLRELEGEYPELMSPDSPTARVGGRALGAFAPVTHDVPLESLNDVFSPQEIEAFGERVFEFAAADGYIVEPKIDGLSVALYYENGVLIRGATRGDGITGEDVTENIKTIKNLPMTLKNAPEYIAVRGEVYMPRRVFEEINQKRGEDGEPLFANPRNAAAGSMRQLDPKVAAGRKLSIIVFNIQTVRGASFGTHSETLDFLKMLGFDVVPYQKCADIESCAKRITEIGDSRSKFEYDIDGAVIKINSLVSRQKLGSTSKAPRWAVAYKYPPEKKETRLTDIVVQVGRTGVLTPKAVVEPVILAGTTVTNATLHNEDFIRQKDIRIGDTVILQKAGEIIPEVIEVARDKRPAGAVPYRFPDKCPSCGAPVSRDEGGAAIRCRGAECPAQLIRNIVHFASKGAMDIDGLGDAVVKLLVGEGLIKSAGDLYYLKAGDLSKLPRMGKKSAENLINAIEQSKSRGLSRVIFALGILQVGASAAKALATRFGSIDALIAASEDELSDVSDIGPVTARNIRAWLDSEQSRHLLALLVGAGVNMQGGVVSELDTRFRGMTFVLTGTLESYTRDEAAEIITGLCGKVSSSVSKKTTYVLAGEEAGSKLTKARELGVAVISEKEFEEMIKY